MTTKKITKKQIQLKNNSFTMIKVESGTFWMGSEEGESNEKPVHKVKLSAFMIGQYPVTQALWAEVMNDTAMASPARFQGDARPVEQVSWEDAILFCNKLSKIKNQPPAYDDEGNHLDEDGNPTNDMTKVKGFRLPTEAEWEYAAIGGHLAKVKDNIHLSEYQYAGSNNINDVAWYDDNSNLETKDVGLKMPNQLGLFEMSGNVWEWCWDWHDDYQRCQNKDVVENPLGGDGIARVSRGGSWINSSRSCRVSFRDHWILGSRDGLGFRLVGVFQSVG